MKEITKTTVFEYDKEGNVTKKTETTVEKEYQDTWTNPYFPVNPYQPHNPFIYPTVTYGSKTTSGM